MVDGLQVFSRCLTNDICESPFDSATKRPWRVLPLYSIKSDATKPPPSIYQRYPSETHNLSFTDIASFSPPFKVVHQKNADQADLLSHEGTYHQDAMSQSSVSVKQTLQNLKINNKPLLIKIYPRKLTIKRTPRRQVRKLSSRPFIKTPPLFLHTHQIPSGSW